ncbi:MAG: DUF1772 domain-containing protein [Gemmataceae bacterium]|nr:DUF1772 domain-containing protein [Gemmataceae bacterium]
MSPVDILHFVATLLAALGSGLIAGVFFIFSTSVMKALARLPVPAGIAAMQSINVVILNPWFFTAFFGTAVAGILAVITAVLHWRYPEAAYVIAGAALYLAGSIVVTIVCNVPKNNALASLAPDDPDAANFWADYVASWTAWNHVRTVASLLATASFTVALSS